VSPDGSNRRQLTVDSKGYRFPTWAPDGGNIAFIGRDDENNSALYVSPANGGEPAVVFSEPASPPFYLYWSPDSSAITFLTQETSDMSMRILEPQQPENARVVATGAPFYWVWSPQSDQLLMHVGGSRAFSGEAHISLQANKPDSTRIELDTSPGKFQAPQWSSDGQSFFYIAENDSGNESIFKIDAETLAQSTVTELRSYAQMVLSPDSRHIAYLQYEPGTRPPFGRAYLTDTDGNNHALLTERLVASVYWSPDGKKLAILSPTRPNDGSTAAAGLLASPLPQELLLRWWVYDLETASLEPLISFEPTLNFLQTIPYFDQYYLSLTFWSPDSRYLVVSEQVDDKSNAGTIWVVDTTGQQEPRKVAEGALAVWSWQ
jgi:Tol biopolymer transport system component